MNPIHNPYRYETWYHSARGKWIGTQEYRDLWNLFRPAPGASLLDVGCGTGYFMRRLAADGLRVTGIDLDPASIRFARSPENDAELVQGSALRLPFGNASFDFSTAVTSLCFISDPAQAAGEMWRVSRKGVVLGLLNRHSLLYQAKSGHGAYAGARWDTAAKVKEWIRSIDSRPQVRFGHAVIFPSGGVFARIAEHILPAHSRSAVFSRLD